MTLLVRSTFLWPKRFSLHVLRLFGNPQTKLNKSLFNDEFCKKRSSIIQINTEKDFEKSPNTLISPNIHYH